MENHKACRIPSSSPPPTHPFKNLNEKDLQTKAFNDLKIIDFRIIKITADSSLDTASFLFSGENFNT